MRSRLEEILLENIRNSYNNKSETPKCKHVYEKTKDRTGDLICVKCRKRFKQAVLRL